MKNIYTTFDISIIYLDSCDCIRTSTPNNQDYDDNEMPLVSFE